LDSAVEAICFLPQNCFVAAPPAATSGTESSSSSSSGASESQSGSGTLVLAPRGYHSLIYVDPVSLQEKEVSSLIRRDASCTLIFDCALQFVMT